jgi:predicted DNA-binding protein (MmcQ/YjbR family)
MAHRVRKVSRSDDPALTRVRELCLALPETSETGSWGHPNFRAGTKTFVTYEWIRHRPSIAFRLAPDNVNEFLSVKGFFPTPYGRSQWVSLYADGRLNWKMISRLIDKSYRRVAIKRMLDALDGKSRKTVARAD